MRCGLLRGPEHLDLGIIAAVAEGPTAISLSKGGAPKTYSHVDPNEDSAAFALGPGGTMIAVADGHHGADAALLAVELLLARYAPAWTGKGELAEEWPRVALDALDTINGAILERSRESLAPAGQTTLSIALIRPHEGRVYCASIGDSHVFLVGAESVEAEDWSSPDNVYNDVGRTFYLGYALPGSFGLEKMSAIRSRPCEGLRAVVVATDGLSEPGIGCEDPAAAVATAIEDARHSERERRPLDASKNIANAALRAHREHRAGDNVASAVVWLDD